MTSCDFLKRLCLHISLRIVYKLNNFIITDSVQAEKAIESPLYMYVTHMSLFKLQKQNTFPCIRQLSQYLILHDQSFVCNYIITKLLYLICKQHSINTSWLVTDTLISFTSFWLKLTLFLV